MQSPDWQVPTQDPHVLKVREENRHQDIRWQEEALWGRLGCSIYWAPGEDMEGEDGWMDRKGKMYNHALFPVVKKFSHCNCSQASQVVRREARQEVRGARVSWWRGRGWRWRPARRRWWRGRGRRGGGGRGGVKRSNIQHCYVYQTHFPLLILKYKKVIRS